MGERGSCLLARYVDGPRLGRGERDAACGTGRRNTHQRHPAEDVLHVTRRYEESGRADINAEFDAFIGRITIDGHTSRRALLLGEIGEVAATQFGYAITLRQRKQRYFTSTELVERAQKSYAHAWHAIGGANARVIGLLLVERTTKGHLRVVDMAAMLCSSAFLPCDSIHEVAMANRLVAERRVFEKPIRLQPEDDMLPDFVLLDTRLPTHIGGLRNEWARKL